MLKKYTLEVEYDSEKNSLIMSSQCEGFNSLEVLGIVAWKQMDVIKQMNNEIKPDVIKRNVVVD